MSDQTVVYPIHVMTWGVGGYNPDMPNNNLIDDHWQDEEGNRVDPPQEKDKIEKKPDNDRRPEPPSGKKEH